MTIDILGLQPTQVSKNLRGVIVSIYGNPKTGKTTISTKFPKPLLLAGEIGYNALAGVKAQPIQKWADFMKVLKQLDNPQAKEMFETIVIDTVDIFYDLCEEHVCRREGVEHIKDIAFGAGYKTLRQTFDKALRSIPMMGYGLVMISHAQIKTVNDSSGNEYSKTMLSLADRPRKIVTGMADIIGYAEGIETEEGTQTVLHLRDTPRFEAGTRWKFMADRIPFNYEALVENYVQAVEKEAEDKGQEVVSTDYVNQYAIQEEKTFTQIKEEAMEVANKLIEKYGADEAQGYLKKATEEQLGRGKMFRDITEDQKDHAMLILDELVDLLNK